jgi:hypothetical protein
MGVPANYGGSSGIRVLRCGYGSLMNLKRFADRAKDAIDKRGGVDGLKHDATAVREAASRPGSFQDKAAAARDALSRHDEAVREGEAPAGSAIPAAPAAPAATPPASGEAPESGKDV